MRVLPFKIPRSNGEPIVVQHDQGPRIYDILHQHPEVQFTLIREGSGTAVIGGYIGEFRQGDVFIIGSDVPHVFRSGNVYEQEEELSQSDIVYLFLDEELPKVQPLNLAEITELFSTAKKGIKLEGETNTNIAKAMNKLLHAEGLVRLIAVLQIIHQLSQSEDLRLLNQEHINNRVDENDGKRLNDIIQFTFGNYRRKITLGEVSEIANMVPPAFCRFFKQRTRKTYVEFLNEIRIQRACKLLLNKDLSIVEIAYESGFNNLSHFNRKFKSITGYSPLKYHQALKGK